VCCSVLLLRCYSYGVPMSQRLWDTLIPWSVAVCWQYVAISCIVLQCVAVGCCRLRCVAVCCSVLLLRCYSHRVSTILTLWDTWIPRFVAVRVAVCCSVLQGVICCCRVLQCVAVRCSALQRAAFEVLLLRGADESKAVRYINPLICCSVLAVCCNILYCVAVCCSVLL
jgi:hypothetical protein